MTVTLGVDQGRWNTQSPAFSFPVPAGWRDLDADELRTLSHLEGLRVRAAVMTTEQERNALVHVTSRVGDLAGHVGRLVEAAWRTSGSLTLESGPFTIGIGDIDGVLLDYICLDYSGDSANLCHEPREDGLPDYMRLLLVVAEVDDWLYLISLYTAEDKLRERAPAFQSILDNWVWTPWAKL
jgi:hypothetical protein